MKKLLSGYGWIILCLINLILWAIYADHAKNLPDKPYEGIEMVCTFERFSVISGGTPEGSPFTEFTMRCDNKNIYHVSGLMSNENYRFISQLKKGDRITVFHENGLKSQVKVKKHN